jgi:hypothetical protein
MKKLIVDVVNDISEFPDEFKLYQCFPNPFNPTTQIKYQLANDCYVKIYIYNTLGEELYKLVDEFQKAGVYSFQFYGSHLASGIYIYKIHAGEFSDVKKMLLIK